MEIKMAFSRQRVKRYFHFCRNFIGEQGLHRIRTAIPASSKKGCDYP
jgi:hypothetical protein